MTEHFKITEKELSEHNIKNDPMLCALGIIDVSPFSEKIDDALYGTLQNDIRKDYDTNTSNHCV